MKGPVNSSEKRLRFIEDRDYICADCGTDHSENSEYLHVHEHDSENPTLLGDVCHAKRHEDEMAPAFVTNGRVSGPLDGKDCSDFL